MKKFTEQEIKDGIIAQHKRHPDCMDSRDKWDSKEDSPFHTGTIHVKFGWKNAQKIVGVIKSKRTIKSVSKEFRDIVKKHGDKAGNCKWIVKNGFGYIYAFVARNKIPWSDFVKKNGSRSARKSNFSTRSIEHAFNELKSLIRKHGNKALSCQWLREHGYERIFAYIRRKTGMGWPMFLKKKGIKPTRKNSFETIKEAVEKMKYLFEKHGDNAKKSSWLGDNGYSGLVAYGIKKCGSWKMFLFESGIVSSVKSRTKYNIKSQQDVMVELRKLIAEHGDRAMSTSWLSDRGHSSIVHYAHKYFNYWSIVKHLEGFALDSKDKINISIPVLTRCNLSLVDRNKIVKILAPYSRQKPVILNRINKRIEKIKNKKVEGFSNRVVEISERYLLGACDKYIKEICVKNV